MPAACSRLYIRATLCQSRPIPRESEAPLLESALYLALFLWRAEWDSCAGSRRPHCLGCCVRAPSQDHSGAIDKREWRQAILKLGVTAHKAALDATFDFFDKDGSGSLSYRELDEKIKARR